MKKRLNIFKAVNPFSLKFPLKSLFEMFSLQNFTISFLMLIITALPIIGWCAEKELKEMNENNVIINSGKNEFKNGELNKDKLNNNELNKDKLDKLNNNDANRKSNKLEIATFAGGCFWCMESPFEKIDGVKSVVSGYTGGHKINPTYEEVSSGNTGHLEAIQITYDPLVVNYSSLLDIFWRQIDPTDNGGSFVDRGDQYRSAIFYHNEQQKSEAMTSKEKLRNSGKFKAPIATEIIEFKKFYPAEEYHQDYYKKNPLRYKFYRAGSGRDNFIEKTWKSDKQ